MKKLFTISLFALSINAFAQVPSNGLVGHWPFSGNANDLSGSGNHGIVRNASLTTDRFGIANSAYQFVGNDKNTVSYIVANSNKLPSGKSPRTISVWTTNSSFGVSGGSGNDGHPMLAYGTPATDKSNEIMFFTNSANVEFVRYAGFNNDLDKPFKYSLQTWYNIVATFDGDSAKIYINNSLIGSGKFSSWNTILDSIVIGTQTARTRFHNGKIDDVRIYNRVLNLSEIKSLFNESICYQTLTVTDTLIINANLAGFNPINYKNTIKVYPNPTKDHITIDFGNNYSGLNGYTFKITNSLSQVVYKTGITQKQTSVALSTWSGNGIYFVHIIDASGNTIDIRKIVLQ